MSSAVPPSSPAVARALGPDSVVAVVVTYHRAELLRRSLDVLAHQTRPPDHVVVVDNGPDDGAVGPLVAALPVPATHLPSHRNLGGAGGFGLGILYALSLGAGSVWLADDDGRPEDHSVLATLLAVMADRGLAEVSPVVVDEADHGQLAFPLRRGLRWRRHRHELGTEFLPGIASLFNGALFTAAAIESLGVPDLRLFVRGDEVEMHRRLVRSGLPFGTCLTAGYVHPSGSDEFKPMLGGLLSAQDPDSDVKRYFTYRNRGYLMSQRGMRWLRPLETVRFGVYFLVRLRSVERYRDWLDLTRSGRAEQFRRPGQDS